MNKELSNLVAKLKQDNVEFRVIELGGKAMTVDDVIKFSKGDINPDEICKTIIIRQNENFFGLVLEGKKKINFKKVQDLLGGKVKIASPDEVKKIAMAEPGAVCPLILSIPVIADTGVMNHDKVNLGSCDHLHGLEVSPRSLVGITNARIEEIT